MMVIARLRLPTPSNDGISGMSGGVVAVKEACGVCVGCLGRGVSVGRGVRVGGGGVLVTVAVFVGVNEG